MGMLAFGCAVFTASSNPWNLTVIPVIVILLFRFAIYYSKFSVPVKRLESISRSPIFSHLSTTINGLTSIRCHGIEAHFIRQFHAYLDIYGKLYTHNSASDRWQNLMTLWLATVVLIFVVFLAIYLRDTMGPAEVGLSIVYAINLIGYTQYSALQVFCHHVPS